jgi:hypothetical protein
MESKVKLPPAPWKWSEEDEYPEIELQDADGVRVMAVYESHGGGCMPPDELRAAFEALPDLINSLLELVERRERIAEGIQGPKDLQVQPGRLFNGSDGRYTRAREALKKAGVLP